MALQGTLDSFALPDVLRLLAATRKSGRLRITGGRGTGNVWVDDGGIGRIEAPHAPHATEPVDALFELLRFEQGSFTFDADVTHEATGAAGDLEILLAAAEALLVEWREIESVVPSMDAWVMLRHDLGSSEVTIERSHWTTVVAVGSGVTVRRMSGELCLPELHVSRAVRDLFDLGLVDIEASAPAGGVPAETADAAEQSAPPAGAEIDGPIVDPGGTLDSPAAPGPVPAAETSEASDAPLPAGRPLRARRAKGGAHLAEPSEPAAFVPLDLPGHSFAGSYDPIDGGHEVTDASSDNVEDLAAAFPGLAHRAVDPTPDAEEGEEGEEGEEQPINRGLLLKLLSSVKS